MRQASSQIAYMLALTTALSACAGTQQIPAPEPPKISGQMAAPPMPPRVIGLPVQNVSAEQASKMRRVGQSVYAPAEEDRVHKVRVGVGGGTNGPQQVVVELPPGEHINMVSWANPSLMHVSVGRIGSARGGRAAVIIKPLKPVAPRVENISILTTQRHIRVDVHVEEGHVPNHTLKLQPTPEQSNILKGMGRGITAEALCSDNNFTWNKDLWWAPMSVCALATPDGTYQTRVSFPPNIQRMPAVIGYSTFGDGVSRPEVVNFRIEDDRVMSIDNVWPVLRFSGEGGSFNLHRGGAQ